MSRRWSPAAIEKLKRLFPQHTARELCGLLKRSRPAIDNMTHKLGLRKPPEFFQRSDVRFPKGHPSWNKGMKGWTAGGRSKLTRFKKGNYSKRWDREIYCVGALRINSDGGLDIKVKEGLRAWESMARFTWRTERGPIPKGGVVRPLNGDPHDTRIENLRMGSRVDLMRENTYHRYPKEVALAIQLRGVLNRQINKRLGNGKEQNLRPSGSPVRNAGGPSGQGKPNGHRARQGNQRRGADHHQQRQGRGRVHAYARRRGAGNRLHPRGKADRGAGRSFGASARQG